jgi:hypothetical protein
MTLLRAWALPICLLAGVALLLPLVAPAGPVAVLLCAAGGAGLVWQAVRRKPTRRP